MNVRLRAKIKDKTSRTALDLLRAYESRNVTFIAPDGSWPIVWDRAKGVYVWDAAGKRYLDLTAAFGVAAAGHANPRVVAAGQKQMAKLLHAMGDVHPHALKGRLARELSRITFERWSQNKSTTAETGKTIFCNSGFEAVEAALKTAKLATGKPGVIVFAGAYHGLGYGALNTTHRGHFRSPFRDQLREFGHFLPFPTVPYRVGTGANQGNPQPNREPRQGGLRGLKQGIHALLRGKSIGAILVEPIQVRGGINVPPPEFLLLLRDLCNRHRALLILDEIYTGFGRTGTWFACEHSGVVPDVICLGKALTGGFPLSACVGRAELMDRAWPPSAGEAIHTSTFLGHPVGCAMALAQLEEIKNRQLVQRAEELGEYLLEGLSQLKTNHLGLAVECRGQGLLAGLEIRHPDGTPATTLVLRAIKDLLQCGYIFLPEGEHANVIGFTPALTISRKQLEHAMAAISEALRRSDLPQPKRSRVGNGVQR